MENHTFSTRQDQLNHLYNQNAAPEDSEVTSFYYHKTLALESIVALLSLFSITLNLIQFILKNDHHKDTVLNDFSLVLTGLGVLTMIFQRITKIRWMQETKELKDNTKREIIDLVFKIILFLPSPCRFTDYPFTIITYSFEQKQMNVNDLLTFFTMHNRFIYLIKFLVHSQLYYGSRPDRLSRLYTVKFGTFNAIKFLINQKPSLVIITTLVFNFVVLPFTILALESGVNPALGTFISCLHFVLVTQVTVGYGDLNVLTIFGRIATIGIVLLGITYTSLLLILFVKEMELSSQEQEAHDLLKALERKIKITKARVNRIQDEWIYSNMYCTAEQRSKKKQQLNALRYNNRRDILLDKQNSINVKRMMLSNFSEMFQSLSQIQEKHNIVSKCLEIISNSNDKKREKQAYGSANEGQLQKNSQTPKKKQTQKSYTFGDDIFQNF